MSLLQWWLMIFWAATGKALAAGQGNIPPLCEAQVSPHLESSVQFWMLQYQRDMEMLEVHRRSTKMLEEKDNLTYEEKFEKVSSVQLGEEKAQENLVSRYKYLKRE